MHIRILLLASALVAPIRPLAAQPAAGAQAAFLAQCRRDYIARDANAARWADAQCAQDWQKVVAAGPAAQAVIAALPPPGERAELAAIRSRMTGVRWAARAAPGNIAEGQVAGLAARIEGRVAPTAIGFNWRATGAEIPVDLAGALRARGATITLVACETTGPGEGNRRFAGSLPGKAPFALHIEQRTAPTAGALSFYDARIPLDGRPPARGNTSGCDF